MPLPASPSLLPCVLALDTATERLAVALQAPGGPWHLDAEGGAAASATLLPQVKSLLAQAGLGWQGLQHIAYGQGPGAFTGLRTACAVAQGLAYGLHLRLLPIDSLLIVAEDARGQSDVVADESWAVAVAMDARMDEIYGALYHWQAGCWQVLRAPALYTLPAWQAVCLAQPVQAVAGSAWAAFGERLRRPEGTDAWLHESSRAAALLRLAVQAAARGEGSDPAEALPLYLRDKVAQTTAEREAVRAAAGVPAPSP
ncbi:tRNA (adenosine(37)-N6)-threonylcarbamoyltransferase complex dimerization subunit type 1 TsaB [Rubrivivax rivuli]|uniref:tRNA (Adenosine(37)-N6)-threonylcarbamoyltransferase complex dimerization subunit type 1 TsaB n=2 Tax=Rubrivivax rivuli TaxID=1862385 RepID=A0A437R9L0_9BURK|nr:tRNA (adenosine(37)-N6)-threonylcarbamoyltransferase complex dimerization subunit type 1 TsaB [Rubrivivax rivuli]